MPVLKNARHERFAQELAKGSTADDAYATAGFKANRGNAATLKAKQSISDRVDEILGRAAAKAEITQEMVLRELGKLGFSDIRKAVKWKAQVTDLEVDEETGEARMAVSNQVQIIDSDQIDDATAAAISEISQTDKGGLKIKFHDKRAALVDIGKHLGMFKDDKEAAAPAVTIIIKGADAAIL
jgi:phage terminase small subunit